MTRVLSVETPTHGRVLVEDAAGSLAGLTLVVFHGYGQTADEALDEARAIPGAADWRLVAVQALHRFYTRGDQRVVASWMTRQDRDQAIADNVAYVDRVIDAVEDERHSALRASSVPLGDTKIGAAGHTKTGAAGHAQTGAAGLQTGRLVFLGFSQGASMAYRAAMLGRSRATGIGAIGGDIPPELKDGREAQAWPPVLIGAGVRDPWYTDARLEADVQFLKARGIAHEFVRYDGAHDWTAELRARISRWIDRLPSGRA